MIYQKIDIKTPLTSGTAATLTTYMLDNSPEIDENRTRPCVIICPGGGYSFVSDREGEAVAIRLNSLGLHACVLKYSVAPSVFPAALIELAAAMKIVRENAGEWHVDTSRVIVAGFSAGAHLAATLGVHWDKDIITGQLGGEPKDYRPDAMMLAYPVITSGEFMHEFSFNNLLGDRCSELKDYLSIEKHVTPDTPRTFIWHTCDDDNVKVENSLLLAQALRRNSVSFELHVYSGTVHGLSLANDETAGLRDFMLYPHCRGWIELFAEWAKQL